MDTPQPEVKKKPGRPPTKKEIHVIEQLGIVDKPGNKNNCLEFVYSDPLAFKNIFMYFKNIKTKQIHIQWTPKSMTFFVKDHLNTQRNVIEIDGSITTRYYCPSEKLMFISMDKAEKVFSAIDTSFNTISFIQECDNASILNILLYNSEIKKESTYKIEIANFQPDEELYAAKHYLVRESLESYPILFTLSSKNFKKTISDFMSIIGNGTDTIFLEKDSDGPLNFSYSGIDINYRETYHEPKDIKLRDKTNNISFRVQIKIANLKSLYNAMLSNDINIYAKEDADMIFTTCVEDVPKSKSIVVSTVLKIV